MLSRALILIFFLSCLHPLICGNPVVDSLLNELNKHKKEDSVRALLLNDLAFEYTSIQPDSALYYAKQCESLAKEVNSTNAYVGCKSVQALVYRDRGQTDIAIQIYKELIDIRTKEGRFEKLVGPYSNIGTVYLVRQDFANAIRNFEKARELTKKYNQQSNELLVIGNLSLCYQGMGDMEKALGLLKEALEMNKTLDDELQEASLLTNIAIIYQEKGDINAAIDTYKRARDLYEKHGHTRGVLDNYVNLMNCYNRQDRYELTLQETVKAEELCTQYADTFMLAEIFICKANALNGLKRWNESVPYLDFVLKTAASYNSYKMAAVGHLIYADVYENTASIEKAVLSAQKGLAYSDSLGDHTQLMDAYHSLYQLYQKKNDHKNALWYLEKTMALKDSFNSADFTSKLASMKTLFDLDSKEKEIRLLSKEKELSDAELTKKNFFLWTGTAGGVLLLAFLILAFRAYRIKRKDNIILENQKAEIEFKNATLNERNAQIERQKSMLEEKNREILDSINYARRIQGALLPHDELLKQHLPDHFVFFKPKDIVSGDFYWATELKKLKPGKMFQEKGSTESGAVSESSELILVCGDSTGHGVPGAFMSLLNMSKLNETINEKRIRVPGQALDHVRKEIIAVLNAEGKDAMQDGMDCSLVRVNRESMTLTYAAANNPVYVVREGVLHICPADKMPVGMSPSGEKPFSTYTVQLKAGDMVYMMTDGFADQFGGPKGKKFKYKPLTALFTDMSKQSCSEQLEKLRLAFNEWISADSAATVYEQVDDILIIGFRI